MSLPIKVNFETLDYVYNGMPWCKVPTKTSIMFGGMDIVYNGQPYVVNDDPASGWSITLNGISVNDINGISVTDWIGI